MQRIGGLVHHNGLRRARLAGEKAGRAVELDHNPLKRVGHGDAFGGNELCRAYGCFSLFERDGAHAITLFDGAGQLIELNGLLELIAQAEHGERGVCVLELGCRRSIAPGAAGCLAHKGDAVALDWCVGKRDGRHVVVIPIGKRQGVGKALLVGLGAKDRHVDLPAKIAGECAHKAVARLVRGAGFAADVAVLTMNLVAHHQVNRACAAIGRGHWNGCAAAVVDGAEVLVLHGGGEDLGYVARGGVQVARPSVKIQAVGILEHGVRAAQLLCLLVHGLDEHGIRVVAGGVDLCAGGGGDRRGGVVAAHDHEPGERVFHGERVAFQKAQAGLADGGCGVVNGDGIGKIAVLERNEGGHDLGDRGDFDGIVGIALKIGRSVPPQDHSVRRGDVGQLALVDAPLARRGAHDDVARADLGVGRRG